jgi:hypothetical protein
MYLPGRYAWAKTMRGRAALGRGEHHLVVVSPSEGLEEEALFAGVRETPSVRVLISSAISWWNL